MSLGEAIRQARQGKGLTQPELGRLLGVRTETVWRWEHEIARLPLRSKIALETVLGPLAGTVKEQSKRRRPGARKSLKRNNRG